MRMQTNRTNWLFYGLIAAITGVFTVGASADPLPGRDITKFSQKPMLATPIDGVIYNGHDELSTAWGVMNATGDAIANYQGVFMADDFADRFNTPVVHVKWWGSYLNTTQPDKLVDKFLIAFESDVPDPDGHEGPAFSHPGIVLSTQVVHKGPLAPGSGTFTEKIVHPTSIDGPIFEYNAELHLGKEFFQQPETVYWLKIVALVDEAQQDPNAAHWGWHNRDYTVPDPFAAGPPIPFPGEHLDNPLVDPAYPAPVHHFQDDSVSGFVFVDPFAPGANPDMPFVQQGDYDPQFYVDGVDGPGPGVTSAGVTHGGIGQFSKDLAFELFTIPEPASIMLIGLGVCLLARRRRA